MVKLTCMRGYSGSGKSTKAREIADKTGAVVVCRDDLRNMLLGAHWTGKKRDEDRVTVAEEAQVSSLLRAGVPVIVDATHLHTPYLRKWARIATRMGIDFEVIDVIDEIGECKRRDHARMLAGGRYVGDNVIERQVKHAPVHKWPEIKVTPFKVKPVEYLDGLPEAIIVDIDGTLAHMVDRSPYDYHRVMEDECDYTIKEILDDFQYARQPWRTDRWSILIVSGRDHTCRNETKDWLHKHNVPYDRLLMRDANAVDERGNKLPDYIVKYDIFNDEIRDRYNIQFVLDDRTQVVEMWRKLGLKCLQVAPGDF